MLLFSVLPDSSQGTDIIQFIKSDEAVAIAIAIAMSRVIAISKPRAKKKKLIKTFLGIGQ